MVAPLVAAIGAARAIVALGCHLLAPWRTRPVTLGLVFLIFAALHLNWGGDWLTEDRYTAYRRSMHSVELTGTVYLTVAGLLLVPTGRLPRWLPKQEWREAIADAQDCVMLGAAGFPLLFFGLASIAAWRHGVTPASAILLPWPLEIWCATLGAMHRGGFGRRRNDTSLGVGDGGDH